MSSPRRGYTLIELLIVLAIIGVLTGLILSAVQRARESAQRASCLNRIRQQGLAVLGYESVHGRLPPGGVQGPFAPLNVPDGVSHGMWPFLLPHLEQVPVAMLYRFDLSYNHPANQQAAAARMVVLMCPNGDPARVEEWEPPPGYGAVADYSPVAANPFLADIGLIDEVACFEGALPVNGMVRLTDIIDGTSNTLLLVEAGGRPGVAWCSPVLPVDLRQVFGHELHTNGSSACMADGSAHFLRDTLDLRILGRLATRAGGEPIGWTDF